MKEIWFWQSMVSPHIACLVEALAAKGVSAHYVAEQTMTMDRKNIGWNGPSMKGVQLHLVGSDAEREALVSTCDPSSIHVCQGIRSNGGVGRTQRLLARKNLKQWVVMETVDDSGWRGLLKRLEYRRVFAARREELAGVLATGYTTPDWIAARGVAASHVFPFAYFLPDLHGNGLCLPRRKGVFRFVFVGQLVARKRVDLLIRTLGSLRELQFELSVVGSGPLEGELRALAESALPGRVRWIGMKPSSEIPSLMSDADCLVLPSRHDGWGAVVSEALMLGTPAICSDVCGSAGVVRASGVGGAFATNDASSLRSLLDTALRRGALSGLQRQALATWAQCLGAEVGAEYLLQILQGQRPKVPWNATHGEVRP